MDGTLENQDPRAFVNASPDEVIRKLVAIIRRTRPDVVTTFEPNGGYGHPDHITINKHSVAAFHAAADPVQYSELGPAWQAQRLFYTAIPRSFFQKMRDELENMGEDTSDFDWIEDAGEGWPDEQVHVTIDVTATVGAKWDALECHRTQFGPGNLFRRLPDGKARQLMSQEYFALAWPEPDLGLRMPDLFSGLD
jgi:LmbE family N-acetylglucosaminyl deacetylase